jgi:hypothetical protein
MPGHIKIQTVCILFVLQQTVEADVASIALDLFFFALSRPSGLFRWSSCVLDSPWIGMVSVLDVPCLALVQGVLVLFSSNILSFHFGSSLKISQKCMKTKASFSSNNLTASSSCEQHTNTKLRLIRIIWNNVSYFINTYAYAITFCLPTLISSVN